MSPADRQTITPQDLHLWIYDRRNLLTQNDKTFLYNIAEDWQELIDRLEELDR